MKRRTKIIIGIIAVIVIIGAVFVGTNGILYYKYAFKKITDTEGVVYIPTGTSIDGQIKILLDSGYISSEKEYRRIINKFKAEDVSPGKYTLKKGMTYRELIGVLRGKQTPVNVTFNNIRTAEKLASVVSQYIEADSFQLIKAFKNDSLIKSVGLTEPTFLSLFIPNTYEFYWNTSAEEFVERMKKEYDRFWSKNSREEKLSSTGLTKEQVSTLASIIIEETKTTSEMPRIAGVYINRLNKGMPLQADPTVKFAMGNFNIKRVLLRHTETDSPYNTYKYAGLPPGVICVPPIVAIDAVLDFEKNDLLYFCANSDLSGSHVFAKTLSEHNKNARKYAAELNRRGIR